MRIIISVVIFLFVTCSGFAQSVAIPTSTPQAIGYHHISNWVWGGNHIFTLLLSIILLVSGWGSRITNAINKYTGGRKYLVLIMFSMFFFFLYLAITLPLLRIRDNAFNKLTNAENEPVFQWILTQIIEWIPFAISLILVTLFGYLLIAKSPRNWWFWATGISIVLLLGFFLIEPLTKTYESLGNSPLEIKISELAGRAGIPRNSIVLDSATDSDDGRVVGLGPTRLMILNATLLRSRPEVWSLQTVAHEAKHFAKDDNLKGFFIIAALFFISFGLLKSVSSFFIKKFSGRFGFSSFNQPASLPLFSLILTLTYLVILPPVNKYRQYVEFEADRFGLEMTQENEALAKMVSSWSTESKNRITEPSLFYMFFRASHPSDAERISFANEYFPWRNGKPLVYGKDFIKKND